MCSATPPGAGGAGLSAISLNEHSPLASPPTMFDVAAASPNCTAGRFDPQVMSPATRLFTVSMPSGSLVTLSAIVMLPAIWLRNEPIQHVCCPTMRRLPPIELSSKSVYCGLPVSLLDNAWSSDHGV